MSGRRFRRLLLFALVVGAAYWYYKKRPTVSGVVDDITQPIMESNAAVQESERNRLIATAVPAVQDQVEAPIGVVREDMTFAEVRALLGEPERVEQVREDGRARVRWIYSRVKRMVVFEEGRVHSIAVM